MFENNFEQKKSIQYNIQNNIRMYIYTNKHIKIIELIKVIRNQLITVCCIVPLMHNNFRFNFRNAKYFVF